ncbi:MAG: serine/threonine protein kinase [Acidobacteria bacterium]|nr:serine/threonine protein kinase [Acidobacteriota bacterium]
MDTKRWQQIKNLFDAVQEIEPEKRGKFLDDACGNDSELRREVERLIESLDNAESFMEQPAAAAVASMFEDKKTLMANRTPVNLRGGKFVAGTVLANRYRIIGLLGKGGMGEVFKAEDIKLNQTVALKFLPDTLEKDSSALSRFHSEVRVARQVSHPNVCRVFDIGEIDNRHFLSMEFIDGDDLSSLLRRIGRLPPDKAVEIARQLCFGLAAIHEAGILHRDLKPANVIIDSRGKTRITDFGIAGIEEELTGGEIRVGTPAYMSPEQITGKEVSPKSDLYSLGLLLYEIFTGKQAFQSDSISGLLQKQQTTAPTNPSEILKDISPLVEKTILQCLEKNPSERPKNALQVAMMLPGGNPLEAAIAAGDTPSPEMVAAAPKKGALKPVVASACLAAVVALFAFIVFFSGKVKLHEWVPLDKSPEVLAERATQIAGKLGYTDAPIDTVYGFSEDSSYLNYAKREAASPDRFEKIRTGQPVALYFWRRGSPRYFVPNASNEVNYFDPPNDIAGMTRMALDVRGRLVEFQAVPPQVAGTTTRNTPTDWSTLFAEAGLDIRRYKEIESQWTPPFFADERKAWEGAHIDHAEIPVRIEAAAFHGKPVYFTVIPPWDKPSRQTEGGSVGFVGIILAVAFFSLLLVALIVARYNLKVGRGDTKGASRLAMFIFSIITLARLIDAYHVPELGGELKIFFQSVSLALFISAFTWIFYIALEPFLRRRWSELLISWSRLMTGDFRDPLVGRDILGGGLLGLCVTASDYSTVLVPQWTGIAAAPTMAGNTNEAFSGIGGTVVHFLHIFGEPVFAAIFLSFLLLLLLTVLRKKWLAIAAMWLFIFILNMDSADRYHWIFWLDLFLTASLVTLAAARFGLLALYSCLLFAALSAGFPITSDFSSWYAGNTLFVFVVLMSLAVYGFYTSLAGQKIFEAKFLKDVES